MADQAAALMRDLARRLLAVEAASRSAADAHLPEAVRVCEKLRIYLIRFAGADGFVSLLRRALALARAEVPAVATVRLKPDGSLEGLEVLAADATSGGPDGGSAAAVAITAHLLGLLVTFIGKPLTLQLVREVWPEASLDDPH